MITEIIILILALLFLTIGVLVFNEKGKWIIAGYNVLSKKERNKYSEKKVCKAAGGICIVCCGILCAIAYMAYMADFGMISEADMIVPALVLLTILISTIIVSGLYISKKGNKKNEK